MTIDIFYPPYPAPFGDLPHNLKSVFASRGGPVSVLPPREGRDIAMVARPYDPAATVDLQYPPFPAPFGGDAGGLTFRIPGARASVYASTCGFTSRGGDTPAHTHFPGYLSESFNWKIDLLDSPDPATGGSGGRARAGVGALVLDDAAGELDAVARGYAWDTRELKLYRGARAAAFSTWNLVADLTSAGIEFNPRRKIIGIRDLQGPLYAAALLDRYDGTGGLGGDAAIKGQYKPQAYGRFFSALPVCLDALNAVFQWHDRRSHSLTAARDGASAITIDGDDPDLATLLAATIPHGHARTCLRYSLIRTGLAPGLGLRVDGCGDAETYAGYGYVETRGRIARRIATTRGAVSLSDPRQVDTASFSLLDTLQSAPVGFWFGDAVSIGDALDRVMVGCAGVWWVGLDARLRVWQVGEPDTIPDFVLEHAVDTPLDIEMLVSRPPRWRTRVGFQQSPVPQSPAELGEATLPEQQLYGNEWRFGISGDEGVRTKYPSATEADIPGGYALQGNAEGEAARQQQLFGVRRELWDVVAAIDPFADVLGKTCEIRGWHRYGFYPTRRFRVVGLEAVAGLGRVKLRLWG